MPGLFISRNESRSSWMNNHNLFEGSWRRNQWQEVTFNQFQIWTSQHFMQHHEKGIWTLTSSNKIYPGELASGSRRSWQEMEKLFRTWAISTNHHQPVLLDNSLLLVDPATLGNYGKRRVKCGTFNQFSSLKLMLVLGLIVVSKSTSLKEELIRLEVTAGFCLCSPLTHQNNLYFLRWK